MLKIKQIFTRHHDLQPLLQEASDRQQLQQLWSAVAPEFSTLSQVLAAEHGILTIGAYSGAVASKIRLLEAGLLRKIQDFCQKSQQIKGLNLSAIKVKVQVKSRHQSRHKRIKSPSNQALNTLESCAGQINNPALEAALRHFIAHQRRR
ncbi:Protein of unknown function [Methylophilus rhizosphaerae]|uniref:DUF721 domain-containing protein n=1 Tax=Methylophilus rhizosphaerae TaxID=492660 RepID=A0A1G9EZI8_9PROT|nr:DciA family protein [Methylophilus rhizosphaerae]SDK81478.1 Protein of unknown function [Methylophilus rhizosphaerae]